MHEVVTLSDGADCEVRVLGLFELQNEVAPEEEPGPFVYTYEVLGGQVVSKTYDAEDFANPPTIHSLGLLGRNGIPTRPPSPINNNN
jgi:hypothetical protein